MKTPFLLPLIAGVSDDYPVNVLVKGQKDIIIRLFKNRKKKMLFAFILTLLAGLSTGIGSLIAFLTRKTNTRFLAVALGFSAGVMVYISLTELLPQAQQMMAAAKVRHAGWIAMGSFFGGVLLSGLIDFMIPNPENPHEFHKDEKQMKEIKKAIRNPDSLMRVGLFTALAITVHNFPEGIATFMAGLADPAIAVSIAIAVAIHNIPEGIAVSIPIFYATGSRKKAFVYSFLSGLAEPVGAVIGYLLLRPFLNETMFGVVFAGISGIMVYISFDELLPAAQEYGEHHLSIAGLFCGMFVMALSLALLG